MRDPVEQTRLVDSPAPAAGLPTVPSPPTADDAAAHAINQRIFETSLDLIMVVNRRGNFIRISPSCETILGYRPDEMIGRSARDFLYPPDLDSTRNEMRLARRGQETRNFDTRYVHKDGRVVNLAWTGVWSESEGQHFFIGRDMTERMKLESQLRQAQKMEAIGQLTGGIAHDFNNILTVIIGLAEIVQESAAGNAQLASMAKAIDEAAERGAQLVQRMLAFARKQPLQTRSFDLNEAVGAMVAMLERTLGADVQLRTVLGDNLWPVLADPSQVENAILNLAVNARDAMPKGGRLLIETANAEFDEAYAAGNDLAPGDYVSVIVTDSGSGMPPEVVERVFEPFFTTKDVGHGTGLGLSMVYGFVKQSRGHVKIYSEVGRGTSIKLYLPRAASAETVARQAAAQAETLPTGRETILVVEDDPTVRRMAVNVLTSLGYQVQEAADGRAALQILDRSGTIDLLFTDLVMPHGIGGEELLRRVRERRPGLKALFTSGYSADFINGAQDAKKSTALLGKPYRRQQLANAVRQALDGAG